jgi:peroxiredoxin
MTLNTGQKAPAFTLLDAQRKEHTLQDFLGKKCVIATIPGAFTSVCTEELCTFQNTLKELDGLGAQVIVLAVDSPFVLQAYAEANKLSLTLLSDYTRATSKAYSGLHEDFIGMKGYDVPKRGVFVLDRDANCKFSWISENPGALPPFDSITEALKSFD